jgi:hypothetical protein
VKGYFVIARVLKIVIAPRRARMEMLIAISMILLAALQETRAALIPFPDFYISVETNDFLHRNKGEHGLSVHVHMAKDRENNRGKTSVDVNSFEFSAGVRAFNEDDRKMFLEASLAAKESREFAKTIVSPAFTPRQIETTFESRQVDGAWRVRVIRGDEVALFAPEEGDRLRNALAEAAAGQAWFESLLTAETLPEATQQARPPRSTGYYLVSKVGEVDARGFIYRVSLNSDPFRGDVSYRPSHTIEFGRDGSDWGSMGANWPEMLQHVAAGLEALKHNADYDFVAEDRKYHVQLNRETKEVDVTFARSDFFTNRTPVVGHVGAAQLQEINALIAEVPAHQAWFQQHEDLFFTHVTD